MCLTWYMYNAGSTNLNTLMNTGHHVYDLLRTELFAFRTSDAMYTLMGEVASPLHEANRGLHLLTQLFIVVGILSVTLKRKTTNFSQEYIAFSLAALAMLVGLVVIPFGAGMSIDRNYPFAVFFLAPFCVLGGLVVLKQIYKVTVLIWRKVTKSSKVYLRGQMSHGLKIMTFLLVIFMLFNTNFIYRLVEGPSSPERPYGQFTDSEVYGASWLLAYMDSSVSVYGDTGGHFLFTAYRGCSFAQRFIVEEETTQLKYIVSDNTYIYLREFNVKYRNLVVLTNDPGEPLPFQLGHKVMNLDNTNILAGRAKIYSNSRSEVYR